MVASAADAFHGFGGQTDMGHALGGVISSALIGNIIGATGQLGARMAPVRPEL